MARLLISEQFNAYHGSFDVRKGFYTVTISVEGSIKNGFVMDQDSSALKKALSSIVYELEEKYIDDIVGRATNEHIGLYILHRLMNLHVSIVQINSDGYEVEVYSADMNNEKYPSRLLYERARSLLYRDKIDDAIITVSKSIELDEKFASGYNLRGRCNRVREKWNLSLQDFLKAVELDPDLGEAHRNIGNAFLYLGRAEETIPEFSIAVKLMPDSALAVNNRGFAYQKLEEWNLALQDHFRAIEIDPNYAEAHKDIAFALRSLDREREAIEHENIFQELRNSGKDTYSKKIFY